MRVKDTLPPRLPPDQNDLKMFYKYSKYYCLCITLKFFMGQKQCVNFYDLILIGHQKVILII